MEERELTTGYAPGNGIRMYYEIRGKGDPLVLIHGGGSTIQSTFGGIMPFFYSEHQLIAMELQAHGRTGDREGPESFEQDADDVAALLKFLKIEKASIIGFSNGGNTAMQIALRHPTLVKKLVVISSFYQREGMVPGFFEGMQGASLDDMPEPLKKAYLEVNNDQKGLQAMFEKDKARMLGFIDWKEDLLKSIQVPVLVISGDRDVMSTEHTLKMSKLFPDARLLILPGNHGSFIGEICSPSKTELLMATVILIEDFLETEGA